LVHARKAKLQYWERKLDNESSTRGLAYSVRGKSDSNVEGIVHDVPTADLPAFLRFEGILDVNFHLKKDEGNDKRRYDIVKTNVIIAESEKAEDCFLLVGRCQVTDELQRESLARKRNQELIEYVKTASNGAIDFDVSGEFSLDLAWAQNL
jgi:hypothetical protein